VVNCVTKARLRDAAAIAEVRNAAADRLTERYGPGAWSGRCTDRGVRFDMTRATVFVARRGRDIVGTMVLGMRKPWAIDVGYFTPVARPLYLTGMAVHPEYQRRGVGRDMIDDSLRIAREWPADAVRLDAFDAPAGAGLFYARCGFRETGRRTYRESPLIYYERIL
jgi:GNAT superfamily N-acetyltransferase